MKENIELITAIIGFLTTCLPLIISDKYRKKKLEQTPENRYNTQVFKHISTYGSNSAVNINAIQTYNSTLTTRYNDENTRQTMYQKTIIFEQRILKLILAVSFVVILFFERTYFDIGLQSWVIKSASLYLILLNSLSLGILVFLLFLSFDRRKFKVICNVNKELTSGLAQLIRAIEGTIYPIILLAIVLLNLYLTFSGEYVTSPQNILWWVILVCESIFCFYKLFNLVIFRNMYTEKIAIIDMIISTIILIGVMYYYL
ncbi:hypothetical protein CBF60_06395 [Lactobacillus taiwanensis]|uniref:hypothetical protein n=1 Tax=Lactobacillus taiwanensis TaxID=508451 RepID=UPI000B993805|nr:hypothetical protein [Lactobacillus taiwanensis]OYS21650.1 hypothetical protein CBF76_01010 [Lactobacillus taiwanensis]OYS25699.1 hypothetical protein CBF55_01180 [Lactobacillus taiwanensis]OYS27967.1 hypothetical protein CBF60_06395 [Lactobacillus taiwanensis]OYS29548.1 hypothetical protein CBF74_06660 [Lactobacillus taiwanensis]OYS41746.1 hypothetical protein CBF83_05635 [Lactobacillus taiwanensis]